MSTEHNYQLSSKTKEHLFKKRVLTLTGTITRETAYGLRRDLFALQIQSSEPIHLLIDSTGGDSTYSHDICDMLQYVISAPVHGYVQGLCASAATHVLLYCDTRVCTPLSRFVIHSVGRPDIRHANRHQMSELIVELEKYDERQVQIYCDRLTPAKWRNKTVSVQTRRKFVQELLRRGDKQIGFRLDASEAVQVGLIERVVTEEFGFFND